jgi:predicted transcriptional regulator
MAAILKALMSEPLTGYQMIGPLNLNFQKAKLVLVELRRRGLAEAHREKRSTIYSITSKGRDWLSGTWIKEI